MLKRLGLGRPGLSLEGWSLGLDYIIGLYNYLRDIYNMCRHNRDHRQSINVTIIVVSWQFGAIRCLSCMCRWSLCFNLSATVACTVTAEVTDAFAPTVTQEKHVPEPSIIPGRRLSQSDVEWRSNDVRGRPTSTAGLRKNVSGPFTYTLRCTKYYWIWDRPGNFNQNLAFSIFASHHSCFNPGQPL